MFGILKNQGVRSAAFIIAAGVTMAACVGGGDSSSTSGGEAAVELSDEEFCDRVNILAEKSATDMDNVVEDENWLQSFGQISVDFSNELAAISPEIIREDTQTLAAYSGDVYEMLEESDWDFFAVMGLQTDEDFMKKQEAADIAGTNISTYVENLCGFSIDEVVG